MIPLRDNIPSRSAPVVTVGLIVVNVVVFLYEIGLSAEALNALVANYGVVPRRIAEGLGVAQTVNSPTFVILRSYTGDRGLTLHHLDFYRLSGDADLETVGLEDCFAPDAVVVVEWPAICPGAFDAFTLTLRIEIVDETTRRLHAVVGSLPFNLPR